MMLGRLEPPLVNLMTFKVTYATPVSCTLSKSTQNVNIPDQTGQDMTVFNAESSCFYILKSYL
jgi:hypothetical protein